MTTAATRLENLRRANTIKAERKEIRDRIHTTVDAAEVVRTHQGGMPVTQVLDAIHGWSLNRTEAFMTECMIPYYATLGGERQGVRRPLTDRQRDELASMLEAM